MKSWKITTALLACAYLLSSGPATAQVQRVPSPPGLLPTPDSSLLRPARLGQPFPYPQGVSVDLNLYRRLREHLLLADTLLTSRDRRIDTLQALLRTADERYANCAGALQESLVASRRQEAALANVYGGVKRLDKQANGIKFQPFSLGAAAAFIGGLVLGIYLTVPR